MARALGKGPGSLVRQQGLGKLPPERGRCYGSDGTGQAPRKEGIRLATIERIAKVGVSDRSWRPPASLPTRPQCVSVPKIFSASSTRIRGLAAARYWKNISLLPPPHPSSSTAPTTVPRHPAIPIAAAAVGPTLPSPPPSQAAPPAKPHSTRSTAPTKK
jgi:hypothetical protein